jgi:hypothetical protein
VATLDSHIFIDEVVRQAPALMSAVDRAAGLPFYGCCDRAYWAWRYRDFPDATLQNTVAVLAGIWRLPATDRNPYGHAEAILECVEAGLRFLRSIQRANGSFDQVCPNEQSIGATAYALHGAMRAFDVVRAALPIDEREKCLLMLRRGADFVAARDETYGRVSNHVALYARVLLECAAMLGEPRWRVRALQLLDRLHAWSSSEGWLPEYEGPDAGYQTQCLAHLTRCAELTSLPWAEAVTSGMVTNFLQYAIHPDGSIGGEYGSRNNEVFYPSGFARVGRTLPLARRISSFMIGAIVNGRTVGLASLDHDNRVRLALDYLDAAAAATDLTGAPTPLPFEHDDLTYHLPDARLLFHATRRYYAVVSGGKGGVVKVFDKTTERVVCDDGGCVVELESGQIATTQQWQRADFDVSADGARILARFFIVPDVINTPWRLIAFRILNLTAMRAAWCAEAVKRHVARLLMTRSRPVALTLRRLISFSDDRVTIEDAVQSPDGIRVAACRCGAKFGLPRMASSQYYQRSNLDTRSRSTDAQRGARSWSRRTVIEMSASAHADVR